MTADGRRAPRAPRTRRDDDGGETPYPGGECRGTPDALAPWPIGPRTHGKGAPGLAPHPSAPRETMTQFFPQLIDNDDMVALGPHPYVTCQ